MSEQKFECLPSEYQEAACRALTQMLINNPTSIISGGLNNAGVSYTNKALNVRNAFLALYFGDDTKESAEKGKPGSYEELIRKYIPLNKAEAQSGVDRVKWAEGLIRQLPENHDGRNSWLLNFGSQNNDASITQQIIKASRKAESVTRPGFVDGADSTIGFRAS